ncbi:uncharacterized protein LOC122052077 [Zingiber officinale]|uniref:uncharacterized protein LOC122052077 n=1 Tax=Zingiber officinale TaxID=94328 RepID=UPI001C4DA978|nr:uncharacterized protein LOC122052077 [Zingiber officinale]
MMNPMRSGERRTEIKEEMGGAPNDQFVLDISTSRRTLLGLADPSPSPIDPKSSRQFRVPFANKLDWTTSFEAFRAWIKEPMNMALFLWTACVVVSGALLFLVMTGMLNAALPRKSTRDVWFEVNNQILNALFTLMCLYQHPRRFHHLALLIRWEPADAARLRKLYCRNGTQKPNERMHMLAVLLLLHLNCFAQYALCALNLGYRRSARPAVGVGLCLSAAIGATAVAGLYSTLSPLGREYEGETEESKDGSNGNQRQTYLPLRPLEERRSPLATADSSSPQWAGGLFDFWDDISLAYLSVFCSCCVFGWNMNRLGFGNMYVHVATFLLFCFAPLFIFNMAAVNVNDETAREALAIAGCLLCFLGLLYGGFWRIQMRKKFNLPQTKLYCCKQPDVADCFGWLCCCSCSLAQEVRTADYLKEAIDTRIQPSLSPLRRENGNNMSKTITESTMMYSSEGASSSVAGKEDAMNAPVFSTIER